MSVSFDTLSGHRYLACPAEAKLQWWGMQTMARKQEPNPWRYAGVGLELVAVVGVLMGIGYLLDQKFETEPWCMLTGALLGIVGGLYNLVKDALRTK